MKKVILRHPAVVAGATTRLPKLYNKQVSFSKLYGGQVAESAGFESQVKNILTKFKNKPSQMLRSTSKTIKILLISSILISGINTTSNLYAIFEPGTPEFNAINKFTIDSIGIGLELLPPKKDVLQTFKSKFNNIDEKIFGLYEIELRNEAYQTTEKQETCQISTRIEEEEIHKQLLEKVRQVLQAYVQFNKENFKQTYCNDNEIEILIDDTSNPISSLFKQIKTIYKCSSKEVLKQIKILNEKLKADIKKEKQQEYQQAFEGINREYESCQGRRQEDRPSGTFIVNIFRGGKISSFLKYFVSIEALTIYLARYSLEIDMNDFDTHLLIALVTTSIIGAKCVVQRLINKFWPSKKTPKEDFQSRYTERVFEEV